MRVIFTAELATGWFGMIVEVTIPKFGTRMSKPTLNTRFTHAQRKVVAELTPELADRLLLDTSNQRTLAFTHDDLQTIEQKAHEAIRHAENGWLCREKDPDDLAEKLLTALDCDRKQIAEAAVATAAMHDWQQVAENYFACIESSPSRAELGAR